MNKKKLSIQDMCMIGFFTAVICVLGQISIPMPYGVPMTLQTLAIPLAGVVLGAKRGTISTLVYIIIGALGLPVFAGFASGIGVILGPTGGFLLSFPVLAWFSGLGADKGKAIWLVAGLVIGVIINYICGMLMFSLVTSQGMAAAFFACVFPFIPTGIVKIILVATLGTKIKSILIKGRLLRATAR
ncbi:MAG: biotin transporter BioY [Clostridiales Family XIII bacterium]|nr:biotin transporter BioY [Clostridiales Family XIII bacterium]